MVWKKGFDTIIFLLSRSLQVWKMRIECKIVTRFSNFQTRWLCENEYNKMLFFLIFQFLAMHKIGYRSLEKTGKIKKLRFTSIVCTSQWFKLFVEPKGFSNLYMLVVRQEPLRYTLKRKSIRPSRFSSLFFWRFWSKFGRNT